MLSDPVAQRLTVEGFEATEGHVRRFGHGFWRSIWAILSAVVLDYLLVGFAIATAGW